MNINKPLQFLVLGLSLMSLPGCLDNDDDDPAPIEQNTQITVTPSLGLIKNADIQVLTLSDNQPVSGATGSTGDSGSATITIPAGSTGPFIVEVMPTSESEYFDEAKGTFLPLPTDTKLRAVLSALQSQVGVTTLTEIAANSIVSANVTDASSVNAVNEQIRKALAPALQSILQAPQLISENAAGSVNNDQGGIYAVTLAALANLGSTQDNPALAILNSLKADFLDNQLDGKVGDKAFQNPIYNADSFISDLSTQITTYANSFGVSDLASDINSTFLLNEIKKTLEGLEEILDGLNLDDLNFDFIPDGFLPDDDDDDNDGDDQDDQGNDDSTSTLTITGTTTTAGITTELPAITVNNVPAPNPEDLNAIEQQIKTQVESQGITVTNLEFNLVSASSEKVVVSVKYSFSTSGVTVTADLTYTWSPGYTDSDSSDDDSSDDMLPDALSSKVFTLTFKLSESGSSYTDGQKVRFTFSSSGKLFIDVDPDASNGDEITIDSFDKEGDEYNYSDQANGFRYSVAVLNDKLHEVNLFAIGGGLLGQFVEQASDGEIPSLEALTALAGTYVVTGDGHSRGTVIIGQDGAVDFDSGVSYAASDIVAIFDRKDITEEPRVQVNYGSDDDGPSIRIFLNTDLQTVKMMRYTHNTENISVEVTVESISGGGN
ncbi:hypothetical protein N474_18765 [Pseudoalteromonas luteoviolacea CPMOR-2]|uniref:hypothetical protein n=1 Tax=Pseudoalteromonas luteoviolacea TaxID=43657 RepID=UPI0007B0B45F|nr:hypothetical protein [Pseudoalteromonas luteoviolacea]KZN53887.1 hypothetical protein N474_18765 [Pseudoalteromonas luteoviolacea CPMOR-2]